MIKYSLKMMEVLDDQIFTEDDGSFGHHTLMHKDNSVTVAHRIVELASLWEICIP